MMDFLWAPIFEFQDRVLPGDLSFYLLNTKLRLMDGEEKIPFGPFLYVRLLTVALRLLSYFIYFCIVFKESNYTSGKYG